jgi:hypothetical protein
MAHSCCHKLVVSWRAAPASHTICLPDVPAAGCPLPLQVLVTCTRNQAVDAVVDKLTRVEGSLLVFGREERLGTRARRFLLKERVAQHPHVLAWLSWIEELQELMQLVEQAPAEGDDEDAAAVLDEALRLVRLPSYCLCAAQPAVAQPICSQIVWLRCRAAHDPAGFLRPALTGMVCCCCCVHPAGLQRTRGRAGISAQAGCQAGAGEPCCSWCQYSCT